MYSQKAISMSYSKQDSSDRIVRTVGREPVHDINFASKEIRLNLKVREK